MKKITKPLVTGIIILGILIFVSIGYIFKDWDFYSQITTTISISAFFWFVFTTWLWKFKFFHPWLVPFPNLAGKWKGYIESSYFSEKPTQIPIDITIRQNLLDIYISLSTSNSNSYSISSDFNINSNNEEIELIFTYRNEPKLQEREKGSEIHYGTTILRFLATGVDHMEGEYWTVRKTCGTISLRKEA